MKQHAILAAVMAVSLGACSGKPVEDTDSAAPEVAATSEVPTDVASPAQAAPGERNQAIEDWIRSSHPDMEPFLYRWARTDLDGDGTDEFLVYVAGPSLCGSGGCGLAILSQGENAFDKVAETTVTQLPVGVLETSTNGWKDLWVSTFGGGAPLEVKKLAFDGTAYPKNPTVAPAQTIDAPGTVLIESGELIRIE